MKVKPCLIFFCAVSIAFVLFVYLFYDADSADSEISGRYSPVCSEPEADGSASKLTANKLLNLEASEVDHDSDELDTADDKSEDDQENSQGN